VVSVANPYGRILGFLDPEPLLTNTAKIQSSPNFLLDLIFIR
jgi:hypothetical protein